MLIRVYRNTHRQLWSVKEPGQRVHYLPAMTLKNCRLIVSQKGRLRVLKTGEKNVHAWIEGKLVGAGDASPPAGYQEIRYAPGAGPFFYLRTGSFEYGWPVWRVERAILTSTGKIFALLP